jgi:hypothetical protein
MGILDKLFGPTTVARFAAELIKALRKAGEKDDLLFDASENCIINAGGQDGGWTINLANLYQNYLQQPRSQRADYLRSTARAFLTPKKGLPEDFDLARADLRPKLMMRATLEHMRLSSLAADPPHGHLDLPSQSIGEHLVATLAYDWPESVQSLSADDLKNWSVTIYEALEVARENLEQATQGHGQVGEGFYTIVSGDTYDASRITLVDHIRALDVNGKHIALVPNRNTLFITGSDDDAGLAVMVAMAQQALQQPYPLSAIPLILEDGEWQDWIPPEEHPLHRAFKQMEIEWLGPLYSEQEQLLNAVHEKQGIDIFVASFSAIRNPDGERLSYCVWGEGVDTLLPLTQKVAIVHSGQEDLAVFGDWSRVVEVVGALMEPTEHYPRRYRVREFPDATARAAIGLHTLG